MTKFNACAIVADGVVSESVGSVGQWVGRVAACRLGGLRVGPAESTDATGNNLNGGDWLMETDNDDDVSKDYLDKAKLATHTETMGPAADLRRAGAGVARRATQAAEACAGVARASLAGVARVFTRGGGRAAAGGEEAQFDIALLPQDFITGGAWMHGDVCRSTVDWDKELACAESKPEFFRVDREHRNAFTSQQVQASAPYAELLKERLDSGTSWDDALANATSKAGVMSYRERENVLQVGSTKPMG